MTKATKKDFDDFYRLANPHKYNVELTLYGSVSRDGTGNDLDILIAGRPADQVRFITDFQRKTKAELLDFFMFDPDDVTRGCLGQWIWTNGKREIYIDFNHPCDVWKAEPYKDAAAYWLKSIRRVRRRRAAPEKLVRSFRRRPVAVRGHIRRRVARHLDHPPGACLCHRSKTVDKMRRGLARRLR